MIYAPLVTMAAYGSSGIMGEALSESGVPSVSPVWVYCLPACRARASLALMTPLSDLSFTYIVNGRSLVNLFMDIYMLVS